MAQNSGRRLVIPAAGNGRRFAERGFVDPKPFIPIDGRPMLELVVRNMRGVLGHVPALIILREDMMEHAERLAHLPDVEFVFEVDPRGTAATMLSVMSKHVGAEEEVIVANSDQIVLFDRHAFAEASDGTAGTILTFECPQKETKWSYAEVDDDGNLVRVAEKVPISTHATVGIYRYATRERITDAIQKMMDANDRTNNEFYLCPAYNYLERGELAPARIVNVDGMFGLGTPEDFEASLAQPALRAYIAKLLV